MSSREADRIQEAALQAAARPLPFLLGLASAWAISLFSGVIAVLLASLVGYLGTVVGILVLAPGSVAGSALPQGGEEIPLLPAGEAEGGEGARRKMLPEDLRKRYQGIHREVSAMLEQWPDGRVIPLERGHLEAVPEAFRRLAYLRGAMVEGDPGIPGAERRLRGMEEQVERLRRSWSLLVTQEGDQDLVLEALERTGDELEALLEVGG